MTEFTHELSSRGVASATVPTSPDATLLEIRGSAGGVP